MRKKIGLAILFLLVNAGMVTSQPFTASVVVFPGCGSQFAYGQKVCGQLYVSDDAWVTRWVEDQFGTLLYHYGNRYYTAGSHTICGYAGLPIGLHIMKIYAVRVSDGAIVEDQCEYTVCCGFSVFIPHRPVCNCEDVVFAVDVNKTHVTPGDDVTVTVEVTNNMAPDCRKKFDAGHLEIDWGILGGNTSPLVKDLSVSPGETRRILEETHIIPPVSEGEYNVVIFYSDDECTWVDYAVISVELPTEGSFEILGYPDIINVDEEGIIKLLIRNRSEKDAQFTVLVDAPSGIYVMNTVYTVTIPQQGYEEVTIKFEPEEVGIHTIHLELTSEGKTLGVAPLSFRVEKPLSGKMEVLLPPSDCAVNETTSVIMRIENPGLYNTVYQISAVTENVEISPISDLYIPKSESRDAEIFMTPLAEGVHEVMFTVEAEGQLMDTTSVSFTAEAEKGSFAVLGVIIAAIVAAMAVIVFLILRRH